MCNLGLDLGNFYFGIQFFLNFFEEIFLEKSDKMYKNKGMH